MINQANNSHISLIFLEILKIIKEKEKIEKTKRLKIDKDISLIKEFLKTKQDIFNYLVDTKLEEKEYMLENVLKEIDRNMEDQEILRALLRVYAFLMKEPLLTDNERRILSEITPKFSF